MVGRNLLGAFTALDFEIFAPDRDELNLLCRREVISYLAELEVDAVVHCAGLVGGIQANISSPYDFATQNMTIGCNVVEGCRQNGIEKLINLGSSCMYPKEASNPLQESSILTGALEPTNEGYGLAKVAVSRLCRYANQQYGTDFKTLIPCNLFGRYDHFDLEDAHLIPGAMHRLHLHSQNQEGAMIIWGDGTARREFMYASDLADFVCFALENYQSLPTETNVGLGRDYTVREYYEMIAGVIGYGGDFEYDLSKPRGMEQKLVDISRQTELGWSPPTQIDKAINLTYRYFLEEWL